MTTNKNAWDRELDMYAATVRTTLPAETRDLIRMANFDLYYGPIGDGTVGDPMSEEDHEFQGYPGFQAASRQISDALREAVPRGVYWDAEVGYATDSKPPDDLCGYCNGTGESDDGRCPECDGRGGFDAAGDWYHFERRDIINALVGRELGEYV